MQARAVVVVSFVPCTNYKPNRYSVKIREFPNKSYPQYGAENQVSRFEDVPQYLAETRIKELGLNWTIQAHGILPDGSHVFTV